MAASPDHPKIHYYHHVGPRTEPCGQPILSLFQHTIFPMRSSTLHSMEDRRGVVRRAEQFSLQRDIRLSPPLEPEHRSDGPLRDRCFPGRAAKISDSLRYSSGHVVEYAFQLLDELRWPSSSSRVFYILLRVQEKSYSSYPGIFSRETLPSRVLIRRLTVCHLDVLRAPTGMRG
ncbi:hypothetical protein EVAR_59018_1 [Eumeta japonica]|uniref:Uncharacterized protein n=1 Tax=Eumeta variegata TaxID=151549 RepID=A0A4C1ZJL7_EUMVA|nr:hypothetical protein EVAR_59018_1 [Eumeta japonica]